MAEPSPPPDTGLVARGHIQSETSPDRSEKRLSKLS
jgi:hypothetical protein